MSKQNQIQRENNCNPEAATSSMTVTLCQLDSYWVPGNTETEGPGLSGSHPDSSPEVDSDEFEAVYHWFLS